MNLPETKKLPPGVSDAFSKQVDTFGQMAFTQKTGDILPSAEEEEDEDDANQKKKK